MNRPAKNGPTISYDEFGPLEIRPYPGVTWNSTDRPFRLPATYTRGAGTAHWMAFYDLHGNRLWGYVRRRKRARDVLDVLRRVRRQYPSDQRIHLILDNLSAHKTPDVLRYFRKNNIHPLWTPTNASWMNPIESQFTHVKEFVIRGSYYIDHRAMALALDRYARYRNKQAKKQHKSV